MSFKSPTWAGTPHTLKIERRYSSCVLQHEQNCRTKNAAEAATALTKGNYNKGKHKTRTHDANKSAPGASHPSLKHAADKRNVIHITPKEVAMSKLEPYETACGTCLPPCPPHSPPRPPPLDTWLGRSFLSNSTRTPFSPHKNLLQSR